MRAAQARALAARRHRRRKYLLELARDAAWMIPLFLAAFALLAHCYSLSPRS